MAMRCCDLYKHLCANTGDVFVIPNHQIAVQQGQTLLFKDLPA